MQYTKKNYRKIVSSSLYSHGDSLVILMHKSAELHRTSVRRLQKIAKQQNLLV